MKYIGLKDKGTNELTDIVVYDKINYTTLDKIKKDKEVIIFDTESSIDSFFKYEKGDIVLNESKINEKNTKMQETKLIQEKLYNLGKTL